MEVKNTPNKGSVAPVKFGASVPKLPHPSLKKIGRTELIPRVPMVKSGSGLAQHGFKNHFFEALMNPSISGAKIPTVDCHKSGTLHFREVVVVNTTSGTAAFILGSGFRNGNADPPNPDSGDTCLEPRYPSTGFQGSTPGFVMGFHSGSDDDPSGICQGGTGEQYAYPFVPQFTSLLSTPTTDSVASDYRLVSLGLKCYPAASGLQNSGIITGFSVPQNEIYNSFSGFAPGHVSFTDLMNLPDASSHAVVDGPMEVKWKPRDLKDLQYVSAIHPSVDATNNYLDDKGTIGIAVTGLTATTETPVAVLFVVEGNIEFLPLLGTMDVGVSAGVSDQIALDDCMNRIAQEPMVTVPDLKPDLTSHPGETFASSNAVSKEHKISSTTPNSRGSLVINRHSMSLGTVSKRGLNLVVYPTKKKKKAKVAEEEGEEQESMLSQILSTLWSVGKKVVPELLALL